MEYCYSGTESLWYGSWNRHVCRKGKCAADRHSRSTGVNPSRKQRCCSPSCLWSQAQRDSSDPDLSRLDVIWMKLFSCGFSFFGLSDSGNLEPTLFARNDWLFGNSCFINAKMTCNINVDAGVGLNFDPIEFRTVESLFNGLCLGYKGFFMWNCDPRDRGSLYYDPSDG